MSQKKTAKRMAPAKINVVYPENLSTIYSNYAQFTMSPVDMHVDFGIRHDGPRGSEV